MAQLARIVGPLLGFFWVYRAGGYAKAARIFPYPITQPGLHRQIGMLETSFAQRLFEKGSGRSIVPTRYGRELYRSLTPFLQSLQNGLSETLAGEVRVHVSRLVIDTLLPTWVARVAEKHPKLVVVVHELRAPDVGLLQSGVADVAIAHFSGPAIQGLNRLPLCTLSPYLVYCDTTVRHTKQVARALHARLAEQSFIAYRPDLEAHALQRAALARLELAPRFVALVDSSSSAMAMVAAGVGFAIVPALDTRMMSERGLSSVNLTAIAEGRTFAVEALVQANPDPLVAAFIACAPQL